MLRGICLLRAVLMESDWVLIWLSFAARYADTIFHRQAGCMLMILPRRGSEAVSSHRDPCHRRLIREVRASLSGWFSGRAAVPVTPATEGRLCPRPSGAEATAKVILGGRGVNSSSVLRAE